MFNGVNPDFSVPSQSATFRRTVAERMEAYQQRVAERIRRQLELRGEQPKDLAYHLGINPRTPERWIAGETMPQPRHFRGMADYFGVAVAELKPDLEAEEKRLQEQLDRIEENQDQIFRELREIREALQPSSPPAEDPATPDRLPGGPDRPPDAPDEDVSETREAG